MMRVVFMGTPDFAVPALNALADFADVVAVYTQPDRPAGRGHGLRPPPVKVRAQEIGIPVHQPEKLTAPGELEKLQALRPDAILVVAYGQILRGNVLELPPFGCVNIHSSLLPRWRGAAPIQWSILAGDKVTGVTTMFMVEKLDAGDILLQAETAIRSDETAKTLHDRLSEMGGRLVRPTLEGLRDGTLAPRVQSESETTYASKLTKDMEWLDPARPAVELDRQIRALNPWPGTSIMIESGERIRVRRGALRERGLWEPRTPGMIAESQEGPVLTASSGAVLLEEVQWEGKRPVDGAGFRNGLKGHGRRLPLQVLSGERLRDALKQTK